MNKDELILLRKELLRKTKRYTATRILGKSEEGIRMEPTDIYLTVASLEEKYLAGDNEKKAVDFIEDKLEEIIRNSTCDDVDYDAIQISLPVSFFVSQKMAGNISNDGYLQEENYDADQVLDNLVKLWIHFSFVNKGEKLVGSAEKYLNDEGKDLFITEFLVNYEKFSQLLFSRDFSMSQDTFKKMLFDSLHGNPESIITIEFTKQEDFKKKK